VTELLQASYRGSKERQLWRTFEKTTLPGGFFVCGANLRRYSQLRQERFTAKNLFITICYPQKTKNITSVLLASLATRIGIFNAW